MRTAEQGQAAAPQERERRRRYLRLPGRSSWAVGEYLTDCHKLWSAIQRSSPHGFRVEKASGFAMGASAFMVFCLRKMGLCGPKL